MQKSSEEPHYYGGQAVMEGVMMRGKKFYSMAVRKPNGEIAVVTHSIAQKKHPLLKLPIIRGIYAFGSSLSIGMKTLTESAEIATDGEPEEATSRFEQFLQNKLGDKFNDVLIQVSVVFAIAIAVLLFVLLPLWLGSFLYNIFGENQNLLGLFEGFARLTIFLLYVLLISRSKDIKRVFQYHGAEHKTINAYEQNRQNSDLEVDNIQGFSRLHNRCGTSFLLIVMIISIFVFTFVRTPDLPLRLISRLVLIPVVAGLSYEVIRWAGRSKSRLVKAVSFPGLCLQHLTTKEPDAEQMEVAAVALKTVLQKELEQMEEPEETSSKEEREQLAKLYEPPKNNKS
ncbi:MAG: DUF1385 domain-containing protein [Firmicutes bacterium]|nr:DUF1385 domain-containing protein [Bacillota bacterium]